jgi:hypothetical protein
LIEAGLGSTPIVLAMGTVSWHLRNLAELPLPASQFMVMQLPAWGSALVGAIVAPLLLWLAAVGVGGAEYRTDR